MKKKVTDKQVMKILATVIDPELKMNIVEMGLIYGVRIDADQIIVKMTLTTPYCPLSTVIVHQVEESLKKAFSNKKIKVNLVFDPPWSVERMRTSTRKKLGC